MSKLNKITARLCLFFISVLFLSVSASATKLPDGLLRDIKSGRISVDCEITSYKLTPLMLASAYNNNEAVRALLRMGANPNRVDPHGWTALMYALQQENSFDIVQRLLNAGSNPNIANPDSQTALILASSDGHANIVGALLDKGAKQDQVNSNNRDALFFAAKEGHIEVIKKLIAARHDNQETIKYVSNAIGVARHFNHMECVDILEQYRAPYL